MLFHGNRVWVYPQSVKGRFQQFHRWSGRVLLAVLLVTPWISIGGHPAMRIDVPARKVYALGTMFTASDGFLLALLGFFAALSLFLFTSLLGRLWCGYACPQTVFLEELIRPVERYIEGDRVRRMARDRAGVTWNTTARKAIKFLVFAAIATGIAMSVMSYFAGARPLWTGHAGPMDYTLVGIIAGGWFLDFAWFREQLCNYLCPYARFQGALADDETFVVSYDAARGEPRGGPHAKDTGNCIECNKCVTVCPQGIDIRDGYQLECIACGRCIDACEGVMEGLGHPSLVKYAPVTVTASSSPRLVRPRTVVYGALLSAIAAGIVGIVAHHQPMEATVVRSPGSLYTVDPDGSVRNTFIIHVTNLGVEPGASTFHVAVDGLDDAEVSVAPIVLKPSESRMVPLILRLEASEIDARTTPFEVRVFTDSGDDVVRAATFATPGS